MKILLNNKEYNLIYGNNFIIRLKGLMFKRNIKQGIYFPNCNSIHTFFMKENIDVLLLDSNNKILYSYKDLSKNKILIKKNVKNIIELPKNSIKEKENVLIIK